jgi:5-formyltetrahydrofolate cyclo-ligase
LRQASLQYKTESQFFSHFFRHLKGLKQTGHIFSGKNSFFMLKSELRTLYLSRRNELGLSQRNSLSADLNQMLESLFLSQKPRKVHTFLPIGSEPDILPFVNLLLENRVEVFVPVVLGKQTLRHCRYSPDCVAGKFGTLQPRNPQWIEILSQDLPDWVLVPLLCFDKKGFRVGYGGGFYDKMLSELSSFKVGISFFDPVDQIQDLHPHDIDLDICLTPQKIWFFA